jgi:hypothetical protein
MNTAKAALLSDHSITSPATFPPVEHQEDAPTREGPARPEVAEASGRYAGLTA